MEPGSYRTYNSVKLCWHHLYISCIDMCISIYSQVAVVLSINRLKKRIWVPLKKIVCYLLSSSCILFRLSFNYLSYSFFHLTFTFSLFLIPFPPTTFWYILFISSLSNKIKWNLKSKRFIVHYLRLKW